MTGIRWYYYILTYSLLYRFGSAGEHSGVGMVLTWLGLNFAPETAKKIKERKRERKNKNNINNI